MLFLKLIMLNEIIGEKGERMIKPNRKSKEFRRKEIERRRR